MEKVSKYFRDEINRLKGIKEEVAARGRLNVLLRLFGPVVLYFVFLGVLRLLVGPEAFPEMLTAVFLYLVALGKEMVAPLGAALVETHPTVSMPLMILALAFDDIICALWMLLNWNVIKFIPVVGRFFAKAEKSGRDTVKQKKWLGRFSAVGLALLVTFPMRGSGGIVAPIIGKMIGLSSRSIFLAVVAGGIAGFALLVPAFYYAMEPIQRLFGITSTWTISAIMFAVVAALVIIYSVIQKRKSSNTVSE